MKNGHGKHLHFTETGKQHIILHFSQMCLRTRLPMSLCTLPKAVQTVAVAFSECSCPGRLPPPKKKEHRKHLDTCWALFPYALCACLIAGQSHPLIHPTKSHQHLPEATWEEEVTESPLYAMGTKHPDQALHRPKDSPHLVFEITSDDGFQTRADTWEGEFGVSHVGG